MQQNVIQNVVNIGIYVVCCVLYLQGVSGCYPVTQPCVQVLHQRRLGPPHSTKGRRTRRLTIHQDDEQSHFLNRGKINQLFFFIQVLHFE